MVRNELNNRGYQKHAKEMHLTSALKYSDYCVTLLKIIDDCLKETIFTLLSSVLARGGHHGKK